MLLLGHSQQENWEYRRAYVIWPAGDRPSAAGVVDPRQGVDALAEAVDRIDVDAAAGWMLAGVRIEEDRRGRCWLNVLMKRPLAAAAGVRDAAAAMPGASVRHRAA